MKNLTLGHLKNSDPSIENCFKQKNLLKGRWKRETMGVRKEANVRQWSRTVAIEVYLQFEHAAFE
jgi:hypothetical protein